MNHNTPPSSESVRAALQSIPPDVGHDERVRLAFAVFDALGDAGADLWKEWAAGRSKHIASEDAATWRSARKPGPVKVGTLFAMAKAHGFTFDAVRPVHTPTQAELKAQAAARRAAAERERVETEERQRVAAADARALWDSASEVAQPDEVPYLQRKGVQAWGVRRLPNGELLVPARSVDGELVNVQRILPTRPDIGPDKLFLRGARKTGTFHAIGWPAGGPPPGDWLLIAEGYATGATVHEATGRPVVVAWDAGNLVHVVRALRTLCPGACLALCADDDRATEATTGRNPGCDKAREAARAVRGCRTLVILPQGLPADGAGGSDFNDLAALAGLSAVREVIEGALAEAGASTAEAEAPGDAEAPSEASKPARAGRSGAARGRGRPATSGASADETGEVSGARDRFRVDSEGLWFDPPADEAGDARPLRICGPLVVEALARDAHDSGAALLLQFDTPFRSGRRWLMPLAMLAGDGTAYRAELLNQGFMVPTDSKRRALMTAYLQSRKPAELVRIVDRVGWHGRAYVLPRETLGDGEGERIMFQSETPTEGTFDQRGTLESWQWMVGRHCIGNSRLAFFTSLAFAGPLLAWASGTDGGGFHLVGDSSCGKTTALRVAASVWGGRDYLQRWRATDNGLEGLAAQHSDGLLCLDELAQLDAKVAGESAYMLANGQGKSRAGRTGATRPRQTWRLLFASAGEIGLAEHMAEAGKRTRAGQELRMVDMPADAGAGWGAFDSPGEHFDSAGELAQHLTRATERVYGVAGRAWLLWLVDHADSLTRQLRERVDMIEHALVPEAAAGQVQRVGRRFALVAAAGELATEAGVTGWPARTATDAAHRCFADWLAIRRGGAGLSEDAEILRQVRQWLQAHGHSARCPNTERADDDHAPQPINQAGWRKPNRSTNGLDEVESWEWFLYPEVFAAEVCKGLPGGDRAALQLLRRRGHLAMEGRHLACRRSVRGIGKLTVYVIRSSILSDSGED